MMIDGGTCMKIGDGNFMQSKILTKIIIINKSRDELGQMVFDSYSKSKHVCK